MKAVGMPAAGAGGGAVALSGLRRGETGVIRAWGMDGEDAALLKAMGLCNGSSVTVVRTGHPCVVAVGGDGEGCSCGGMCRIGLARGLAEKVFVEVA